MYSTIDDYVKNHLESAINVSDIQVGFFGDLPAIDFRKPAILLEPRNDPKEARSTRWDESTYNIRLWVMVEIYRDYMESKREIDEIIGADGENQVGVMIALKQLAEDPTFAALSGTMGGKEWRIKANDPLNHTDVTFGINQRSSSRLNTAQLSVSIYIQKEK